MHIRGWEVMCGKYAWIVVFSVKFLKLLECETQKSKLYLLYIWDEKDKLEIIGHPEVSSI